MHFSELPAEQRVTEGARWLDEHGPSDWWERIDYDILDISDGSVCILGQVFAEAARDVGLVSGYAYAAMPNWYSGHPNPVYSPQKYGFCGCGGSDADDLRTAWIEYIENRISVLSWLPEPVNA